MRVRWLTFLSLGVAALLPGKSSVAAGESEEGARVYARHCETCHGVRGDGNGPNAFRLEGPPPRDFTRGAYKFRSTPGGTVPRHEDIMRTVAEGVGGTTMPAWKKILPLHDIDVVSTYLESFSPRFAETPNSARVSVRLPPAPTAPPTAVELAAGRMLRIAFRCWECHGESGEVDGPLSLTLHDDKNRRVLPVLVPRGVFRSGARLEDLYRTVATGLEGAEPGSANPTDPMPMWGSAVIVGREGLADLGVHAAKLDPKLRSQAIAFISKLPTQAEIDALNDAQRAYLGERRIWLMVQYVRSLVRPRGPANFLFDDAQTQ